MYRPGEKVFKKSFASDAAEELTVLAKVFKSYVFCEDGMYPSYEYILADKDGNEIPGAYPGEELMRTRP